jgi:excisionase family DNA binding protein
VNKKTAPPLPMLYTITQAARVLGFSDKQTWRMVAARELPSIRLGGKDYVPRLALESMLQQVPSVSAAEAIANLAKKAVASGYRAERVEIDETETRGGTPPGSGEPE